MFTRVSLSTRILMLGIAITAGFVLLLGWMYPTLKGNMYEEKNEKTRDVVRSAHGVVDYYARQAKSGAIPVESAKAQALAALSSMKYGADGKEYFWVNDLDTVVLAHPNKDMVGKSQDGLKDVNGKAIFQAFVDVARKDGEGIVNYWWKKPGAETASPKISFVKMHPEWGWIVGSGIYVDDVQKDLFRLFSVLFGVAAAILAGSIGFSWFMAKSITKPIDVLIDSLGENSNQMAASSEEVASCSQNLAEGASSQAASLEETAAAMEEMAAMTSRNTESAGQVKRLSDVSGDSVDKANVTMTQLVGSMAEISSMGEEIGKIIKTIDEIAFQTNLLALNAAVEAARAGEAGAGFAVVADEVRNLAQRAAAAAKSTSELIEGSIRKIKEGTALVEKTNVDFAAVTVSVHKVTALAAEIAAASQEQSRGITEVTGAVSLMDKVTQTNAASAEEIASASEEMYAQANNLNEIVGRLQLLVDGERKGHVPVAAERPVRELSARVRRIDSARKPAAARLASVSGKGVRVAEDDQVAMGAF